MSAAEEDVGLGESFVAATGLDGPVAEWAITTLRLFPVPSMGYAPCLFSALDRIVAEVPWAAEVLPSDGGRSHLAVIAAEGRSRQRTEPERFPSPRRASLAETFGGPFGLSTAVLGLEPGEERDPVLERLRCVLVACRLRWGQLDPSRNRAIEDLATFIRGRVAALTRGGAALPLDLVMHIVSARTLAAFVDAAHGLTTLGHETLARSWAVHFDPELRGHGPTSRRSDRAQDGGTRTGAAEEAGPRSAGRRSGRRNVRKTTEGVRRSIQRKLVVPAGVERLPGEPPSEVGVPSYIGALPGGQQSQESREIARYRLQQAIRGRNHDLLLDHPDVLPLVVYTQVIQAVLETLDGNADRDVHYGACGLLLAGIFGRTTRTLTAVQMAADASHPSDAARLEILRKERAARVAVYWQATEEQGPSGYFRPSPEQAQLLEPIGTEFLLPLAPAIFARLEHHRGAVGRFGREAVGETLRCIRLAAQHIAKVRGLEFTPGQLRSSASVHLRDVCGDTAAAQLICADTFGLSDCPVSYFAPLANSLATTFWLFQHRVLGVSEVPALPFTQTERVGSRLVALPMTAKTLVKAVSAPLRLRAAKEGRVAEVHQAMINQLSCMLIAGFTHRPTQALLELTLADIWVDGDVGAALFADKRIDAAHDPRLVTLSATACGQLKAYLSHLAALAAHSESLKSRVAQVLRGEAPLFFSVTDALTPAVLTFDSWKAGLPAAWRDLPLNWGRHYSRTRAIESGVPPDLVNIQMGHLESVGYPFSGASPTEPLLVVEQLAPLWERVVRGQGWTVVAGLGGSSCVAVAAPGSLQNWGVRLKQHERRRRESARSWEDRMRATSRSYREAAEAKVLAHPALVERGIADLYLEGSTAGAAPPHGLTRPDFNDIRDDLIADAVDPADAIARGDALRRIVGRVNRRTGEDAETPGTLAFFRAPLDNAFVPGMMTAVRQVTALREHVGSCLAMHKGDDWRNAALAFARATLAMALFSHVDDPERMRGAIERRLQLRRSAALDDVVLVPWGDGDGDVMALRGAAGIAFAHVARKLPEAAWPGWRSIEEAIATLLPPWAIPTERLAEGQLIDRLCQAVALAARYELSPGARLARGPAGCTSAAIDLQLAWLDGDPPGGSAHTTPSATVLPAEERAERLPSKGASRTQYLALCRVFPTDRRDTHLPATGRTITSGEAASVRSRDAVIDEIRAMRSAAAADRCLRPIVDHLAGWVLDMLVNGTARKRQPALSSVETYLTRVGGLLVESFGNGSLDVVDETELEDVYLTVIEAKSEGRATAAAALLSFHRYAQAAHDYPDIDLSGVFSYLRGREPQASDACPITPMERNALIDGVFRGDVSRAGEQPEDPTQRRLMLQAGHAGTLLGLTGARRGEGLGIQFRDVRPVGQELRLRIRGNSSRRLKTPNARRYVSLAAGPRARSFARFVQGERQRLDSNRLRTAYVFALPDQPRGGEARSQIASTLLDACRAVTGRASTRVHALRHLVAAEKTLPSFLVPRDYESLAESALLGPAPGQGVVLPRDLAGRVVALGHGSARTTIRWYHHMPWLLASRTDAWLAQRYVKRRTIAGLLGVTPFAMDAHTRGHRDRPCGRLWLDAQCEPRSRPSRTMGPTDLSVDQVYTRHWSAADIGRIILDARVMGSLQQAVEHGGGTPADSKALRTHIHVIERRLGWRLIAATSSTHSETSALPLFRRLEGGEIFEEIWRWYDVDPRWRRELTDVARAVLGTATRGDRDAIVVPRAEGLALMRTLGKLGVNPAQVEMAAVEDELLSIRVLRNARTLVASTVDPHEAIVRLTTSDAAGEGACFRAPRFLGRSLKWALAVIYLADQWREAGTKRALLDDRPDLL